jgi:hypothetical protein
MKKIILIIACLVLLWAGSSAWGATYAYPYNVYTTVTVQWENGNPNFINTITVSDVQWVNGLPTLETLTPTFLYSINAIRVVP